MRIGVLLVTAIGNDSHILELDVGNRQRPAGILRVTLEVLTDRTFDINLIQQIQAAAQVQAQRHGSQTPFDEQVRRTGREGHRREVLSL